MIGFRLRPGNSGQRQQIGFFQAQVHERNGQGRGPTPRRALNYAGQRNALVANLFRLAFFVHHQVSGDGHAQPAGGQIKVEFAIHPKAPTRFQARPAAPPAAESSS